MQKGHIVTALNAHLAFGEDAQVCSLKAGLAYPFWAHLLVEVFNSGCA